MTESLDKVEINFEEPWTLFLVLGFIMFGVALELKVENFTKLIKNPKSLITGVLSQFVLLPALTFCVVWLIKPQPSVALGMFLVAACPGGNISNFISSIAKGNVELSVSLTAFSTVIALFMIPVNFSFWGGLYPPTSVLMKELSVDSWDIFKTIILMLGIPVAIGMFMRYKFEELVKKIIKPIKIASIVLFAGLVVFAFSANIKIFLTYIHLIALIVLAHNAAGLSGGYLFAWAMRLPQRNRRAISIETGMQNSGLALTIALTVFPTLGGMAMIAAWWGIWHIISGLGIAAFWSRRGINDE